MFHLSLLFIIIIMITGFVSLSLVSITYLKEKNPLLGYHFRTTLLFTVMVISVVMALYFYFNNLFPQVIKWLSLFANLVYCSIIFRFIILEYPAKIARWHRIADITLKVLIILISIPVIIITLYYEKYIVLTIIIFIILGFLGLIINLFIIFIEKKPAGNKEIFNWSFYTKSIFCIYFISYPVYSIISLIVMKKFDVFLFLEYSFLICLFVYPVVHLFSITYIFHRLIKPNYQINPVSINSFVIKRFGFSDREAEIAGKLIEGLTYNSIGQSLFISLDTVKTHVKSIYRKTGINKRLDLIRVLQNSALRNGE